jgi:putative addiction module CopG family antidote
MNINFSDTEQNYIKNMVESGYYSSEAEFVQDAVRILREQYVAKQEKLLAALERGDNDIRLGKIVSYTPNFLDECEERAMHNLSEGKKPSPDVCA